MIILAFDTCLDKMYIALNNNDVISSKIVETTQEHYHSAFLISSIRDILAENQLTPQDVNVLATNIGPGSFTGIRACTTVARIFAQGINGIKTIGISSLEILSRLNDSKEFPRTLVAIDARKGMAYTAIYEDKKEILPPQAMMLDDLSRVIADRRQFVVCDDKLAPILNGYSYQNSDEDLGKILLKIAEEKLEEGIVTDWRNLHPLYIQPPPITDKQKQK